MDEYFLRFLVDWVKNQNTISTDSRSTIELPMPLEQVHVHVYKLLPPDTYNLRVVDIALKTAKNNKGFILMTYEVTDDEYRGRTVRDAIFPHSEKLMPLITATDINMTPQEIEAILFYNTFDETVVDNLHCLLNRQFRGYVTSDEKTMPDGTVRTFNKVSAYVPIREGYVQEDNKTEKHRKRRKERHKEGCIRTRRHVRIMELDNSIDPDGKA